MRECALAKKRPSYDGDTRTKYMKSGCASAGFYFTLSDFDRPQKIIKTSEAGGCLLHEQRLYATHGFRAERKMMSSFVMFTGENDEEKNRGGKCTTAVSLCYGKG